jgi:hypothetical protein
MRTILAFLNKQWLQPLLLTVGGYSNCTCRDCHGTARHSLCSMVWHAHAIGKSQEDRHDFVSAIGYLAIHPPGHGFPSISSETEESGQDIRALNHTLADYIAMAVGYIWCTAGCGHALSARVGGG